MILSSFLLTLVSALAISSAQPARSSARARIVALGDSLTSGRGIGVDRAYPAVLQQRLDAQGFEFTMVNAGISGDTSAGGVRRLEGALDDDVRVLIVALGANDGLRGVPIAQLEANLGHIIETAQARGISVLLCGMEALPIHGWDYSVAFHNATHFSAGVAAVDATGYKAETGRNLTITDGSVTATSNNFALPTMALAIPPPLSPTGLGNWVRKSQLRARPPCHTRYPKMKRRIETVTSAQTPVRPSITPLTHFLRIRR